MLEYLQLCISYVLEGKIIKYIADNVNKELSNFNTVKSIYNLVFCNGNNFFSLKRKGIPGSKGTLNRHTVDCYFGILFSGESSTDGEILLTKATGMGWAGNEGQTDKAVS